MLDMQDFGNLLNQYNFNHFTGVPCSFLSPLINYAINNNSFISANNEGDAIAIASGISLANKSVGIVLMQNSGLCNAISPLTSLNYIFKIPILGFVSLRGEVGLNDEPQHELLGQITHKLLKLCKIKYAFLSDDINEVKKQVKIANKTIKNNESFFFIVRKNTFSKIDLNITESNLLISTKQHNKIVSSQVKEFLPSRIEALQIIDKLNNPNMVVFLTTGKSGRELYEIRDCKNYLYMVGSMGCVSPLALGFSIYVNKKIIAIDGDASLLMRAGNLSLNTTYMKNNFCHICLDNQSHDSTGGQFSLSPICDIPNLAINFGYKNVYKANNIDEFKKYLEDFLNNNQSCFIYLKISKGSKQNLGRPKIKPQEVKNRLQEFIKQDSTKEVK